MPSSSFSFSGVTKGRIAREDSQIAAIPASWPKPNRENTLLTFCMVYLLFPYAYENGLRERCRPPKPFLLFLPLYSAGLKSAAFR